MSREFEDLVALTVSQGWRHKRNGNVYTFYPTGSEKVVHAHAPHGTAGHQLSSIVARLRREGLRLPDECGREERAKLKGSQDFTPAEIADAFGGNTTPTPLKSPQIVSDQKMNSAKTVPLDKYDVAMQKINAAADLLGEAAHLIAEAKAENSADKEIVGVLGKLMERAKSGG